MPDAFLISVQTGTPKTYGDANATDPMEREWTSGIFKTPVAGEVWLGATGLAGDGQADLRVHGGADKAVNAYASEHYPHWLATLQLPEMPYGAFGENFTLGGLTEETVCIGDVYEIGQALVQVSQPRQPCRKLSRRWQVKDLAAQVIANGKTGWYFRVLREGFVAAEMPVRLLERQNPEWSITAANDVMYARQQDLEVARNLAACELLSASWRQYLSKRFD